MIAAFKATLQETQQANLLLHVVDYSDDQFQENIEQVNEVLEEIDANEIQQLMVCNKIDRMDGVIAKIDRDESGMPIRVWLSAQQGLGIDLLLSAITECLSKNMVQHSLLIPPHKSSLRGVFFDMNCIAEEGYAENGDWQIDVRMEQRDWNRLIKRVDVDLESYIVKN
ncbi:GTP-binding proten HflX [Paraglaciecola psychrophila 170]|uniref:GTP-binding proten HflX n=1 Tax=Paraglaciecola psychrophila 170 TaxID=1129794 RepID=M4RK26_9ALTE|nr:GTP-binding proten HflX [Paraglaciecola psychrophila 170]